MNEKCKWCEGGFAGIDGPVHEYIESAPGCWAVYSGILAKEYESYNDMQDTHRLTVDTYAVQHPGKPSRKSRQSVMGHLVSMYYVLEKNMNGASARQKLKEFIERKQKLRWLEPPSFKGTLTVSDVALAKNSEEHKILVRKWAESVWQTWFRKYEKEILSVIME
ncbi:MAG: DUF5946 family protein [Elusimicrobiales bacterium]|nr:DUF5946 family protein [Elusimicrobiales bacterium]